MPRQASEVGGPTCAWQRKTAWGAWTGLLLALGACARSDVIDARDPPEDDAPGRLASHWTGGQLLPPDAGSVLGGSCDGLQGCQRGFHCDPSGQCVLNGDDGPIQATLQWRHDPRVLADLDLHLVEPGGCDTYYGNPNRPRGSSACAAHGSLDLDANAACVDTDPFFGPGADTENVIYPPGLPPSGHYVVRVDYFQACSPSPVDYTLVVRVGGEARRFTGRLQFFQADLGGAGSGQTLTEFDIP